MNILQADDPRIRLVAPLYLRTVQEELLAAAKSHGEARRMAWKSLRQANWLAEIAARASSVQAIQNHLEEQGKRWDDRQAQLRLHQIIHRQIDDRLHTKIEKALQSASKKVAETLGIEMPKGFQPDPIWVAQEHLTLTRAYIHALVNWHRIDEFEEN